MGKTRRAQPPRERPNILVTGTPGTGKTTLAAALAAATSLRHVDVGLAIREQSLHSGWDEEFQCHLVDEDKARPPQLSRSIEHLLTHTLQVCDALEDQLSAGGNVVDYHSCGFFPERCAETQAPETLLLPFAQHSAHRPAGGSTWWSCFKSTTQSCTTACSKGRTIFPQERSTAPALTLFSPRGYSQRKMTENIDCEIFGVVLDEARESYAEGIVRPLQNETESDRARNLADLTAWVASFGKPSAEEVAKPQDKKRTKK